jgi:hypothetical protein
MSIKNDGTGRKKIARIETIPAAKKTSRPLFLLGVAAAGAAGFFAAMIPTYLLVVHPKRRSLRRDGFTPCKAGQGCKQFSEKQCAGKMMAKSRKAKTNRRQPERQVHSPREPG